MPLLLTSFIVHSCPQGEANQRQATDRSATRSVEIYLLYPLVSQHHSSSIVVLETQRKLRGETKKPTGAINIPKPSINVHTPEVAFDDGFKQLQGTVDDFQNVLRTLTADLANVAQMPADTTSGSISREIAFQGFRLGLDELGTSFPKLVKEMSGLAKAVMRPVEGTRPEEADAGGGHQGRKPAMKTSKKTDSKKCSRAEDDHDAEKDGRHHPRPRLIHPEHQNNTSQEVMSTPTSGKRPREATDSDNDNNHCHSKRLRKDATGKGKGTDTYASNSPGPILASMSSTESHNTASGSGSRHDGDTHQTAEDTPVLEEEEDDPKEDSEERRSDSESAWPTSSCRSDRLPPR